MTSGTPANEVSKSTLVALFDRVVAGAIWSSRRHGCVRSDYLGRVYHSIGVRPSGESLAHLYYLDKKTPPFFFEPLCEVLRQRLAEYIDPETNTIGSGFCLLGADVVPKKFDEYVKALVKGAAILGSKRVADLLLGWAEGAPFYCRYNALIEGATIDDMVVEHNGLRISKLPKNSDSLPIAVRELTLGEVGLRWLGGVVLSIECEISPALYYPKGGDSDHLFNKRKVTCPSFPDAAPSDLIEDVCAALALVTNNGINPHAQWFDYGELGAFQMVHGGGKLKIASWPCKQVTDSILSNSVRILERLPSNIEEEDNELDTAIRAWLISQSPSEVTQKFRVLRTAIELLIPRHGEDTRAQSTERAVRELFSDESPEEQCRKTTILCDAYKVACCAGHKGHLDTNKFNPDLLSSAQDICRKIIQIKLRRD